MVHIILPWVIECGTVLAILATPMLVAACVDVEQDLDADAPGASNRIDLAWKSFWHQIRA
ncbi:MAG: hypothetical protein EBW11_09400 [Betaproteobacteria bacterium]|nr:hypothetical protein [Betaproteobacteria bacterium]